tara:strand:+ start:730 stop:1026 length:297 start_codon:yes stop_codon:yes gene_type:complete
MIDTLIIVVFSTLIIWSLLTTYYCIKFARSILVVTESIELALDVLDERYQSISKILKIPIFYDSSEVRQVLEDIGKSRDAILRVASILGQVEEIDDGV